MEGFLNEIKCRVGLDDWIVAFANCSNFLQCMVTDFIYEYGDIHGGFNYWFLLTKKRPQVDINVGKRWTVKKIPFSIQTASMLLG